MVRNVDWRGYAAAVLAAAACTAIGWSMQGRFDLVNIAMVYLLAVVLVALRFARGPAIAAALFCVVAFDVAFVPPLGHFTVDDVQYLLTFAIMLTVALVISHLVAGVSRHAQEQAALQVAAETERVRSVLLASVSHDLRTPLAVMAGASSSLVAEGARLPEAEREALARSIFRQATGMADYVAKILQMTRLATGALPLERDWASLPEIAGAVLLRLAERMREHRVLVEMPQDLPLVRVDAPLVEQALGNLLENAARHTPAGTVVRVRALARPDVVELIVEDYGGDLPDAAMARVAARFASDAPAAGSSDIGMGLAIARAIATLHGGRTWAARVPGGTAFHLALPREAPPPPPESA